jgi:hypothetical protein
MSGNIPASTSRHRGKNTENISYDSQFAVTDTYFIQLILTKLILQYVTLVVNTVS